MKARRHKGKMMLVGGSNDVGRRCFTITLHERPLVACSTQEGALSAWRQPNPSSLPRNRGKMVG